MKGSICRDTQPTPLVDIAGETRKIFSRISSDNGGNFREFSDYEIKKWNKILGTLSSRFGRLTGGNLVNIFNNGDEAILEMLKAIDGAKERVWMEVYIFDDSPLANRFVYALKKAAMRGCDVILLVDYIGSLSFPYQAKYELEKCGAKVQFFNAFTTRRTFIGPMLFRNHKKVLIVDDNTAFCGSVNISRNAASDKLGGEGRFYDIHVKLNGPAVYDLADLFIKSLKMASNDAYLPKLFPRPKEIEGGILVQALESDVSRRKKDIQFSLTMVIPNAEKSIYLTTSYFFPPGFLRRALLTAKRKNLEIHMLLSGNSDVPGDVNATIHFIRKFFRRRLAEPITNSFKVFMTTDQHCHGKAIVIDDVWSSVGSFNWDRFIPNSQHKEYLNCLRLSSRRNLEVSLGIFDPQVALRLKQLQISKENESREYTRADCLSRPKALRIFDCLIYKIVRLSGRNLFDGLSNEGFKFQFKKAFIRTLVDQSAGKMIAMSSMSGV